MRKTSTIQSAHSGNSTSGFPQQENIEQIELVPEGETDEEMDWLTHTFHVRPNVEIEIELPMDLSPNEASRLSQFVAALPFELDG